MSGQSSRAGPAVADERDVHVAAFIATLAKVGYAKKTQRDKERLIVPFIRWVRQAGNAVEDLDDARVDAFLVCPSRRRYKHRTALLQFLEYLRSEGVLPPRRLEPSPGEMLVQRYLDYLRDQQGLSAHSLAAYSPFVRAFVAAQRLPENSAAVDAAAVRRHLLGFSQSRSTSFVRLLAASLRSFLRFCFLDGTTAKDLSTSVPPVRRWRLAAVPPFLVAEEVERVIAAADRSTAHGCRTWAVLMLVARLGLRASEVVALELDDIRWDAGEIVVRGKGGVHDRLPLPADVGEALALYLTTARGPSTSRRVFLRLIAPRVGLSHPTEVSKIAREALERAGLLPTGRVGAHIFRHSLATRMIRGGASLEEISQVLRHRSTMVTLLYAKVDFVQLRGVALQWPDMEVPR